MKRLICFNWSFLLAVSLLACGLADDSSNSIDDSSDSNAEYFQEPNKRFQINLDCISRYANQEMCLGFLAECIFELPTRILLDYYTCLTYVLKSDYTLARCREDSEEKMELYYSAGNRREINRCMFDRAGSLSNDERKKVDKVYNCTEKVAKEAGCAYDDSS